MCKNIWRPRSRGVPAVVAALIVGLVALTTVNAASLNEIRISDVANDDDNNFFEIAGSPGESLDGLSVLTVSGEFEPGQIDYASDLSGLSIPADGYFLAADSGTFYPDTDLETGNDYFGSPTSFLLVTDFTGNQGDDLDTDNDGTLDSTPWTSIVDAVSMLDGDATPDFSYGGGPLVDPDGNFPAAHAYRFPNGTGAWDRLDDSFTNTSFDTPGYANIPEPACAILTLLGIAGLPIVRRR